LAIVDNAGAAAPFLQQVMAFARAQEAHVEIAVLAAGPYVADRLLPLGVLYVPDETLAREALEKVDAVLAQVAGSTTPVSAFGLHDDIAWLAGDVRRSRQLADLILVGASETWETPWLRRRVLETCILSSGTPTLLVPPDKAPGLFRHAVLGWKPSPEANRAVHDLVAAAEAGATVDVVIVDQEASRDAGDELCRHLARHGLRPVLHRVASDGMTDAEMLYGYAVRSNADLLVAGGFGHTRVREIFLGGVTRFLIEECAVPAMLSH
jgi:nucleotide-binding universal stress UspA family protein